MFLPLRPVTRRRRDRGTVIPTERHRREWRDLLFLELRKSRSLGSRLWRSLGMTVLGLASEF
jgi:hypothetical protein